MGTAKRERQKLGRQARLAQAQAATARRKRIRSGLLLAGLVVVLIGVTLAMGGLGDDDEDPVASGDTSTSTTENPFGTATECPAADGTSPQTLTFTERPPLCIDETKTYSATVATSHGEFTLELDDTAAPVASDALTSATRSARSTFTPRAAADSVPTLSRSSARGSVANPDQARASGRSDAQIGA